MALLVAQTIVEAGIVPSYAAATGGGDTLNNSAGDNMLHIKNGSGSPITVTVTAQNATFAVPSVGDTTKANAVEVIANGTESMMGPFPTGAFNDSANLIAITYSDVTSLTIGAFKLPRTA